MKGVAGAVILYNPEWVSVIANIATYIDFVELLYIIDNTANKTPPPGIADSFLQNTEKIIYISNKENEGVAKALNKAAELSLFAGYQWLLTMDQDSYFGNKEINEYASQFEHLFYKDVNVAMVGLSIEPSPADEDRPAHAQVDSIITSGSLVQLATWKKTGGFDEKLFIDEVDHEYCYRVIGNGYKVMKFINIYLSHNLGTKREAGYGTIFAKRKRTIHSPQRVYYMVRNYLYVRNKYKKSFQNEFHSRDKELRVALKNNLFFSGKFFKVLRNILKGYFDFKRNKFGALTL